MANTKNIAARATESEMMRYVHRLMSSTTPGAAMGRRLTAWLRENDRLFGVSFRDVAATKTKKRGKPKPPPEEKKVLSEKAWAQLCAAFEPKSGATPMNPLVENARVLAQSVGLTPIETDIFVFVALSTHEYAFDSLLDQLMYTRVVDSDDLVAICLGMSRTDVATRLVRGPLTKIGLIDGLQSAPDQFGLFVPYSILDALRPPHRGLQDIEHILLGRPATSLLNETDFAHVARERDFITRLLRGALEENKKGVNVLFYGQPGTGKTELAKVIAQQVGSPLYAVGEVDEEGEEPSRQERLEALYLSERLLSRRSAGILLFDEMEDILQRGNASYVRGRRIVRAGSKVFFNRLLENNRVPVIWTSNSLSEFDPAFLRRMSFALEMKAPPRSVRSSQWAKMAARHEIGLSPQDASTLAHSFPVAPSLAQSAVSAVKTAHADKSDLGFVVGSLSRAATGDPRPLVRNKASYECDISLLNPDQNLSALERRLSAPSAPHDVSFCLYGPSGTGKSAYARHLADQMGLDALVKKGSDFLSKWVGETEQLIAEAFEEAVIDKRFLIIDEAETLFWNRGSANRSWEASMVNEFLTWTEQHPLPIACTTNHFERMDPASLRRFTFKVKFDYLTCAQSKRAFTHFFGMMAPSEISSLANLTPGDFASVKKQLRFIDDENPNAEACFHLLELEVRAKPAQGRKVGF